MGCKCKFWEPGENSVEKCGQIDGKGGGAARIAFIIAKLSTDILEMSD
jgi:hypothetical protein